MSAKEKIIEILKAYTKKHNIAASSVILEEYAEELLANGVIVPPCYIGQAVYQLYEKYNGDLIIRQGKVSAIQQKVDKSWKIRITINHYVFEITPDKIGKTVFLTKEEAEKALVERSKG